MLSYFRTNVHELFHSELNVAGRLSPVGERRMRWRLLASLENFRLAIFRLAISCATIGTAQISMARAAEITAAHEKEGKTILLLDGEIVPGDSAKLALIVTDSDNQKRPVSALYLNSPGGRGKDDLAMAALVKRFKISTIVANGAECASACFTVFAAGHQKFAGDRALIGVHRASQQGRETEVSSTATVESARALSEFGVPPAIIGRLVLTPPDQMAWLSADDLRSMNVTIADTLRWPATAVVSGGKAIAKPDGSSVDKDEPAATVTTFDGKPVKIFRTKVCNVDWACSKWDTLKFSRSSISGKD